MTGQAMHVLGLSGGRDSAALAVWMRDHRPELDVQYFFTDTGKELPEVYDYLGRLEGFLGKTIEMLNPGRDFDFWLTEYGHFLPSPRTRWCTRQLKIQPFQKWLKPHLDAGVEVHSYVAIRADEPSRSGMIATHPNMHVHFPLREAGLDKASVIGLLENSGLGLPDYYRWRSRSGCTFCFYQQKIEWVRLMREHPSTDRRSHGQPMKAWTNFPGPKECRRSSVNMNNAGRKLVRDVCRTSYERALPMRVSTRPWRKTKAVASFVTNSRFLCVLNARCRASWGNTLFTMARKCAHENVSVTS